MSINDGEKEAALKACISQWTGTCVLLVCFCLTETDGWREGERVYVCIFESVCALDVLLLYSR